MALEYPSNPTVGQIFDDYIWNGYAWDALGQANNVGTQIAALNAPGRIIQTVSTPKTDSFSFTAGSGWVSVTGLTATITPRFNTSKILVLLNIGVMGINQTSEVISMNLRRNSVDIAQSTGRTMNTSGVTSYNNGVNYLIYSYGLNFQDSPATTSAITYDLTVSTSSGTAYINRWPINTDRGGISTITLLEVAA